MKTPDLITDTVAPLGPNARAMLEDARVVKHWCLAYETGRAVCGASGASLGDWVADWMNSTCVECIARRPSTWAEGRRIANAIINKQPSPRPTVANLLRDARELIARRRDPAYGSLQITDAQIDELARAWVQNLMSNYVVAGME